MAFRHQIALLLLFLPLYSCEDKSEPAPAPEPLFVDERLSAAVTYAYSGTTTEAFLGAPSLAYVSGHFRFEDDLPIDVVMGLDIEWFEGVDEPMHVVGGDWMSFAGFTRTGHLWIPVGSEANDQGIPTAAENVEVLDPMTELQADTWYKMTIICDFSLREFVSVSLVGGDVDVDFDLGGMRLEYPNQVLFDDATLTMYCFASRSAVLAGGDLSGNTAVYFDDMEAGVWTGSDYEVILSDGFETPNAITTAPYDFTAAINPLSSVQEGVWYSENAAALLEFSTQYARNGSWSMRCDASLEE